MNACMHGCKYNGVLELKFIHLGSTSSRSLKMDTQVLGGLYKVYELEETP